MSSRDYVDIALFIFGILMTIIGFFISLKVSRMDEDITKLQDAHVTDVAALAALNLKVAEIHPTKTDLKEIFDNFKEYLDERFNNVEQIARYSNGNTRGFPRGDNNGS